MVTLNGNRRVRNSLAYSGSSPEFLMARAERLRGSGRASENTFELSACMGLLKPWEQIRGSRGNIEREART